MKRAFWRANGERIVLVVTASADLAPRGVERALARQRGRYEQELDKLLTATFRVMRDRDTANPSVADILTESGLSTTAFYRHFPTKDDLLLTLLERAHELTYAHIEARLAAAADPTEKISEWVRAMFDLLRTDDLVTANRPFLLAHPRLLERFPTEISAGFDRLLAPLTAAIRAAKKAAGLPAGSAAEDARLAMHQVFGMLIDLAALRRPADPRVAKAVASYTLRAALHCDLPSSRGPRADARSRKDRARKAH
jgi:AcrR family transcriptional regulator